VAERVPQGVPDAETLHLFHLAKLLQILGGELENGLDSHEPI